VGCSASCSRFAVSQCCPPTRVHQLPSGACSSTLGVFTARFHPPPPQPPRAGCPLTETSTVGRSVTTIAGTGFARPFTSREESTATSCTMVVSVASMPMPFMRPASAVRIASACPPGASQVSISKPLSST
jgi:hypothetical protein